MEFLRKFFKLKGMDLINSTIDIFLVVVEKLQRGISECKENIEGDTLVISELEADIQEVKLDISEQEASIARAEKVIANIAKITE